MPRQMSLPAYPRRPAINAKLGYTPAAAQIRPRISKIDELLPASTFGIAARTAESALCGAQGLVKARYAILGTVRRRQWQDNSGSSSQAVNDVTGGIRPPTRQADHAKREYEPVTFEPDDVRPDRQGLAGSRTLNGQRSARIICAIRHLESVGDGRY